MLVPPRRPIHRAAWVLATAGLALAACSSSTVSGGTPCSGSLDCAAGQECVDGHCRAASDGGTADAGDPHAHDVIPITLMPHTADLVSTEGSMPHQTYTVNATLRNGTHQTEPSALFQLDTRTIGDIDPGSGDFVANGVIGGTAMVTATLAEPSGPLTATAMVHVSLERTFTGDGVPADAASRFGSPMTDPTRAAGLVYPLDHAVMPQNVFPADVQWLSSAAGDLFRVTLTKTDVSVTGYLIASAGFQNDWLVDEASWRSVTQTDPDLPAQITVDRWEAASSQAIAGTPVSVTFARAALTGSVYYWDIQRGRIVRIDDGTNTPVEFLPNPPVAVDGNRCVGCHTVSHSGRYMAGRLGGGENIGAVFDLTTDSTADPAPAIYPVTSSSLHWWFSTWSPDDTRLMVSTDEGASRQLAVYDPIAGTSVAVSGALPSNSTQPTWALDNSDVAYVTDVDTWGGEMTAGDIALLPVTGPDAFGTPMVVHHGSDLASSVPPGNADAYPTWTPDSMRIAFAHGSGSRSENQASALYMMYRDGTGVVRLDKANGGPTTTTEFQPRFSPFDQGGYFWLSFLSRRDYGNSLAGTRGSDLQQIRVTAINKSPEPGTDPSEVAYWLPGQRTTSRNIAAYWAPRPCRPDGESCSVGSECCGGYCGPDAMGNLVCGPPPPDHCRADGETCSTDADCCDGLVCSGHVCIRPPS